MAERPETLKATAWSVRNRYAVNADRKWLDEHAALLVGCADAWEQEVARLQQRVEAAERLERLTNERRCSHGHSDQGIVLVICGHAECGECIADETETGFGAQAALARTQEETKCDGGPRFTDWSEYDGQPKEPKRLRVPRVLRFLRALLEGARPDGEQED